MQCRRVRYTERSRAWRVGDLLGGFVTGPDNQFLQLAKGLGEVVATLPKLLILSLERAHSLVEPAGLTLQLLEFTKTGGKRHEKTLGLFDPEHELLLNLGARFLFAIHLLPAFQFSMSPGFRVECGTRCPRQALEARRNGESRGGSTADGVRPSVAGCSWSPREEPARLTSGRGWERTKAKPLARSSASTSGRERRSAGRRSPGTGSAAGRRSPARRSILTSTVSTPANVRLKKS